MSRTSLSWLAMGAGMGAFGDGPFVTRHKETPQVGLTLAEQVEREAEQKAKRAAMMAERERKKIELGKRKRARKNLVEDER